MVHPHRAPCLDSNRKFRQVNSNPLRYMMQKNLMLGSRKGQSRGVMGGLPVTGSGSPSRKTPQALQEGPQGPPALVWNRDMGRNSVLKGFRCHEKDFRICPVASH